MPEFNPPLTALSPATNDFGSTLTRVDWLKRMNSLLQAILGGVSRHPSQVGPFRQRAHDPVDSDKRRLAGVAHLLLARGPPHVSGPAQAQAFGAFAAGIVALVVDALQRVLGGWASSQDAQDVRE